MELKSPDGKPFELELVEDVPRAVTADAAQVAPPENLAIELVAARPSVPNVDPFLAQATRERDSGVVDAALWARAVKLADGDTAAAATPYLRARAAMLKLAHARGHPGVSVPPPPVADAPANDSPVRARTGPARGMQRRPLVFAMAAVGVVVLATIAWMMMGSGPEPAAPVVSSSEVAAPAPAQAAPAVPAAAPANPAAELAAKVASLKQAGNWNVLVLYAAEWTRKDHASAAAWAELGAGYAKLRQFDEALEAAKKSVALDPQSASYQRGLGEIYAGLDRPADALVALERAVALDERDAESFAQAGRLYLQLARVSEAKTAFERALALDPMHTQSSCGAAEVARLQGRAKEAEAVARALKAAEIACPQFHKATAEAAVPAAASVPVRSAQAAARR